MTTEKNLFLLDVDNIQGYIFDTNKLKTIIGASWLIDHINAADDGDTFNLLIRNGFGRDADGVRNNDDFIYSSGGNTKVIFAATDKARAFEKAITNAYACYGISVTTHIQPVDGGEFVQNTLIPAEKALAQKKYNKNFQNGIPASPYFKICELCGKRYAAGKAGNSIVCQICDDRYQMADKKPRLFPDYKFVSNIEKDMKPRSGMIAVVVMDGNRMGQKIRGLCSIQELKNFSVGAENIIKHAFDESLSKHLPDEKTGKNFRSIRPLIMGGDDICFIIDAGKALNFVHTFMEKVTEESSKQSDLFGQGGIRFSAGMLFSKPNYPFNFAYRIAHSLLRSAKRYSREHDHCSSVDFHILLSSSGDEIEMTREREYFYDGHLLTRKPYGADKICDLQKHAGVLRVLARNKVKSLRRILRLGKHQSTAELLKYAVRMNKADREKYKKLLNTYGWKKRKGEPFWRTGLLDLAELTELAGR